MMDPPKVNPVGVVEHPDDYRARSGGHPVGVRVIAAAILVVFALVVVATTVASIGTYCLTSHAGDRRSLAP